MHKLLSALAGIALLSIPIDATIAQESSVCAPPPSGLVSWWSLDGHAEDLAGANPGTAVGDAAFAPGRVEQGAALDGDGDYVRVADAPSLALASTITLDAWFRATDTGNAQALVGRVESYLLSIRADGTIEWLVVIDGASGLETHRLTSAPTSVLDGALHHVAATYDGAALHLFVDGASFGIDFAVGPIHATSHPLLLGAVGPEASASSFLHGLIDEVQIFDRALDESEILDLYHAGSAGTCKCGNGRLDPGEACDDGNTTSDDCCSSSCAFEPLGGSCPDDGNPCTDQACDGAGSCVPSANSAGCDDGNACTVDDVCSSGACHGEQGRCAPPSDPCRLPGGVCDPTTGDCSYAPKADGTACSDQDACTTDDVCAQGACTGERVRCAPSTDPCRFPGACDPSTGQCVYAPKPDGTACSDQDACTTGDVCIQGSCTGERLRCAPPTDPCRLPGVCDPATAQCSYASKPNGTACSDGNACTSGEACQAGACVGGGAVTCAPPDACHTAATCTPSAGCVYPSKPNGTFCSDGSACTTGDRCQAGVCVGTPKTCTTSDPCRTATCNPSTGNCVTTSKPNGTSCSDDNACTTVDVCQSGSCRGGSPVVCAPPDQCQKTGTCVPSTGLCSYAPKFNGSTCSDGDPCTVGETCRNGSCENGSVPRCPTGTIEADTMARQSNPSTNYSLSLELSASATTQSFVRVRIPSGVPLASVQLRLITKSATGDSGGSIHVVSCDWREDRLTWNNKPALGALVATAGPTAPGAAVDFDLSSVATAGGTYCFGIDAPTSDVTFNSRDASSGRPSLLLGTTCACTP